MTCGIYKIENLINHHIYIGQSIDIKRRWRRHCTSYDDYSLHQAFIKYGLENFSFTIIEECKREELNQREQYWISYYNSYISGYNETRGGQFSCSSSLKYEEVLEIIGLLKNTNLTNLQIGEKYNVSENTICSINTGKSWYHDELKYPIRERKAKVLSKSEKDKKEDSYIEKEKLIQLLYENNGNFTKVGNLLGITDNAVRKRCQKYDLPYHSKDYKKEKVSKALPNNTGLPKPVYMIDKESKQILKNFNSTLEAARYVASLKDSSPNIDGIAVNIGKVCAGKRKTAYGYMWEYIN